MRKDICKCGHDKTHHVRGECMMRDCMCKRYKYANKIPGVRQRYCQDTPPPTYSPSPDPEPIQW